MGRSHGTRSFLGDVLFSIALLKLRHFPGCIRNHPCEENEVLQRAYYHCWVLESSYVFLRRLENGDGGDDDNDDGEGGVDDGD